MLKKNRGAFITRLEVKNLLSARASITKPRSVIITTRYFWQKWRPLLGNSLTVLIIEARRKCYRNHKTGEVRDWFYSTIGDLAKSAGFSPKKVLRLLRLPLAEKFIRYKPTYIYNPELGKKIRGKCLFKVALDDPLIPEDEIQSIREEIHKPVSFESPPTPPIDSKLLSLPEPPASHLVHNNYSTFQEININLNNLSVTNSEQGKFVLMGQRTIANPKKPEISQTISPVFSQIIKELSADSIMLRTILRSCTFFETTAETGSANIRISTPNRYYMRVLESRLKKNMARLFGQNLGQKLKLEIVNLNQ